MHNLKTLAWDKASVVLIENAAKMPIGQERKISEIIGVEHWAPLQFKTRHRFGKHVRANLEHYGLVFVRKAGTIAVYKKLTLVW